MHRLSIFFHDIVGNIDQIIDGTNSIASQGSLHPLRRWTNLDILHHSGSIPWTQIWIFHCDFHIVRSLLIISSLNNLRRTKFLIESRSRLPRNSQRTITVYSIRSDFIFKNHIPKPQCFDGIFAYLRVFRENVDSILRSLRIHVTRAAQLFDGAHHAVRLYSS